MSSRAPPAALTEPAPKWSGLTVKRSEERLEVQLRSMPEHSGTSMVVLGIAALVLVPFALKGLAYGFLGVCISGFIAYAGRRLGDTLPMTRLNRPQVRSYAETIHIDATTIRQVQIDDVGGTHRRRCALASVTGVIELETELAVESSAEDRMLIGNYVAMPPEVRRWLRQSIAARLPEPK